MQWIPIRLPLVLAFAVAGCISTVGGNERALFYSAGASMQKQPVGAGWYVHLPWNRYVVYDLRWKEHHEQIHLHTKDGLHLDLEWRWSCDRSPTSSKSSMSRSVPTSTAS